MLPMLEDHREFDFSKTMHVSLGMASPLWLPFAAATSAGLAFWWMTRWTHAANLESVMGAMAPSSAVEPAMPALEPVLQEVEAGAAQADDVVEAAADAIEAVAEETQQVAEAAAEVPQPVVPPVAKRKAKPEPDAPLH